MAKRRKPLRDDSGRLNLYLKRRVVINMLYYALWFILSIVETLIGVAVCIVDFIPFELKLVVGFLSIGLGIIVIGISLTKLIICAKMNIW